MFTNINKLWTQILCESCASVSVSVSAETVLV